MSKAQRVGNIYFADFGAGAGQARRDAGFEQTMVHIRRALESIGEVSKLIGGDNRKLARLCNDSSKRIADIKSRKALRPGWLDGALRTAGVIGQGETL